MYIYILYIYIYIYIHEIVMVYDACIYIYSNIWNYNGILQMGSYGWWDTMNNRWQLLHGWFINKYIEYVFFISSHEQMMGYYLRWIYTGIWWWISDGI